GVKNLWVACRGAGISAEAHHSLRMQRDLQRLGEVAGLAAAMSSAPGVGAAVRGESRQIDLKDLQNRLVKSGALSREDLGGEDDFGRATATASCEATPEHQQKWLADIEAGYGAAMYHLMQNAVKDESVRKT